MFRASLLGCLSVASLALFLGAPVGGQPPANLAGTTWVGSENLQGYGRLSFQFSPGGRVTMIDTRETTAGSWTQAGQSVTLQFYSGNVLYTGTTSGNTMSGTARNVKGKTTWAWSLTLAADLHGAEPQP